MGYLAPGGKCFSTSSDAADAYFGSVPMAITSGSTAYFSWLDKVAGVWVVRRQSVASNGAVTIYPNTTATVPSFPACDPVGLFNDGLAVGWGIAAVLVLAWGLRIVRGQLA